MDKNLLKTLPPDLSMSSIELLAEEAQISTVEKGSIFLRTGEYVKMLPVVVNGLVRGYSSSEDKDLLLYYIKPGESCIMSFSSGLTNQPSIVNATTESESVVMLIPVRLIPALLHDDPGFSVMFFHSFNHRYIDLIDTINQLIFLNLDDRILDYLRKKAMLKGNQVLDLRHHEIARELGTAREVVSRVIKKLEKGGKLMQLDRGIKIFEAGDKGHR